MQNDKSIHLFAVLTAVIYSIWLLQSHTNNLSLNNYLTGNVLAFLLLYIAFTQQNLNHPKLLQHIVFWALVFRLLGLFAEPILEDDQYRYMWDGYQFVLKGTPYGIPPAYFFSDPSVPQVMQAILDRINYPEIATIYGPVSQWVFAAAYLIAPGSLLALKSILIAFDIAGLLLLKRFATNNFFIFYAWNPLIIKEVAFSAHHDAIGVFFMIAALYLYQQKKNTITTIYLALAVAAKTLALILVPLMIFRFGPRNWLIFVFTICLCYLPFIFFSHATDLMGLLHFSEHWEFNSSVFALLKLILAPMIIKLLSAGLLIVVVITLISRTKDQLPHGDILLAVLFLLSPVVNSWYLLWILPFAVIFPSRGVWLFSFTVCLSYITGLNLNDEHLAAYNHPLWVRFVEYLPVFFVIYCDIKRPLTANLWIPKNENHKSH